MQVGAIVAEMKNPTTRKGSQYILNKPALVSEHAFPRLEDS